MVQFFDLISFFAIASLFAWLGYGPLRGQQIANIEESKREKANENLGTLTDSFMGSFAFFCIAAIADYLLHQPSTMWVRMLLGTFNSQGMIILVTQVAFGLGLLTLVVPMAYIRRYGTKNFADVEPPKFGQMIFVTYIAAFNTFALVLDLNVARTLLVQGLVGVGGLVSYYVDFRLIVYGHMKHFEARTIFLLLWIPTGIAILFWIVKTVAPQLAF